MAKRIKLPSDKTARRRNFLMNVLYPICRTIGNMLHMDGEKIDDYFIEKNNRIITSSSKRYRPEELLLIFPHCLQDWECPNRIYADIHNCKNCGKCDIPELIEIGDRYNVAMSVSEHGHELADFLGGVFEVIFFFAHLILSFRVRFVTLSKTSR